MQPAPSPAQLALSVGFTPALHPPLAWQPPFAPPLPLQPPEPGAGQSPLQHSLQHPLQPAGQSDFSVEVEGDWALGGGSDAQPSVPTKRPEKAESASVVPIRIIILPWVAQNHDDRRPCATQSGADYTRLRSSHAHEMKQGAAYARGVLEVRPCFRRPTAS